MFMYGFVSAFGWWSANHYVIEPHFPQAIERKEEKKEDEEDQEVDDRGNTIYKSGLDKEEDDEDDGGDEDKGEKNRRRRQYNDKYELDKMLLYLIFAKATN